MYLWIEWNEFYLKRINYLISNNDENYDRTNVIL